MKLYFDFDLYTDQKYGIIYATLELFKALKKLDVKATNFASGRAKNITDHKKNMHREGFDVTACPIPKKIITVSNKLGIDLEKRFLKDYDFFVQIGIHHKRNIPSEKYIISIHDTVGLRYPENETAFPLTNKSLLNQACKIYTVSEFSKKEIIHFFNIPPDKIAVIPNGCDHTRFRIYTEADRSLIKKNYHLPSEYFVAYGGKSPRKNIPFLTETYSELAIKNKPSLVVFGQHTPTTDPKILSLGYLPEKDVPIVLSGAKALIIPSYYEGFGLPMIEAFACGVPVISANASSLPEVANGNAIFFDPFNKSDLTEKIKTFLEDSTLQKKLISDGLKIAKNYTWEKSAHQLLSLLESLK